MDFKINRIEKLLSFDSIRIGKIIEMIQLTSVYTTLAILASYFLNKYLFFHISNVNYSVIITFIVLVFELSVITILAFYLRKFAFIVPSIPSFYIKNFKPHTTMDYTFWITFIIVFIGTVDKVNSKIDFIKEYIIKKERNLMKSEKI